MSESDVVIRVEGLGKTYALHHEKSERYTALRDVVARQARAAGRLLNPFTLAGQLRKAQRQAAVERAESEGEFWALKDVSFSLSQQALEMASVVLDALAVVRILEGAEPSATFQQAVLKADFEVPSARAPLEPPCVGVLTPSSVCQHLVRPSGLGGGDPPRWGDVCLVWP
ncbi:hypothetical protein VB716_10565 [Synechococcus sp. CCY9201]|uniref:hypothetical protein n=1 Tax=Synechococcus sp. CCY9201 TaxID=174697 RepID=UPI002B20069B|nr:hypothetical protein [Synechococcus sp. CCY9201]MEA5474662.1 hypothetical protein [Synechococcus sp. CCY9201]